MVIIIVFIIQTDKRTVLQLAYATLTNFHSIHCFFRNLIGDSGLMHWCPWTSISLLELITTNQIKAR